MAQLTSLAATQTLSPVDGFRGVTRIKAFPPIHFDEPPELGGTDTAPSPLDYLLTAVGGCLVSSFTLCLQKKRVEATLSADVSGRVERDAEGMLRVQAIEVELRVTAPEESRKKVEGCYQVFKKYCIVSASVARGIPLETRLHVAAG